MIFRLGVLVLLFTLGWAASAQPNPSGKEVVLTITALSRAAADDSLPDRIVLTAADGGRAARIALNGGVVRQVFLDGLESLKVVGSGDDDTLVVDNSDGFLAGLVIFLGEDGFDTLELVGSLAVDQVEYSVGPGDDEGLVVHRLGDQELQVLFAGLEPVTDTVPGVLTVNGTNASNAITYRQGTFLPAGGQVAIDAFETFDFANKTSLTINGLGGADAISLNNPNTPTGLNSITINGGDPTDSDSVVANGTTAQNAIEYTPSAPDGGALIGAGPVPIALDQVESLLINGQGGDDTLKVYGTSGDDSISTTAGASPQSGSVLVVGTVDLLEVGFTGLGEQSEIQVEGNGGNDTLVAIGSDGRDSWILGGGFFRQITFTPSIWGLDVSYTNFQSLQIRGLNGADEFEIAGGPSVPVWVLAGDDSGLDLARVRALADSREASFMAPGRLWITSPTAPLVDLQGMESVVLEADTITVRAGEPGVGISATPLPADMARIDTTYGAPQLYADTIGTLTLDGLSPGGGDVASVILTDSPDVVSISPLSVNPGPVLKTITINPATIDALSVFGLEGTDTLYVESGEIPIFIDGGDPLGQLGGPGDLLDLQVVAGPVTYSDGPDGDSGQFQVAGWEPVSFDHVEQLGVNGVPYFRPDAMEPNEDPGQAATVSDQGLISDLTVHMVDPTVGTTSPDFFLVTTGSTGMLRVRTDFALGPGLGDLDLRLLDTLGSVIAESSTPGDGEELVVPVVAQESYLIHVFSTGGESNEYELFVETTPAPTPTDVVLDPDSDTGFFDDDGITGETQPRLLAWADLDAFQNAGIAILDAAQVGAGETGAAVEIQVTHTDTGMETTGFADPIGSSAELFELIPDTPLPDGHQLAAAAVRVIDGQSSPATDRGELSPALSLTIDGTPPQVSSLSSVADTGDGDLAPGEETAAALTQVAVVFSEEVYDPPGDTDPDDVTNPANYLLLGDGGDFSFETLTCEHGTDPLDTEWEVDSVFYDGDKAMAYLRVNDGISLPEGLYELRVCGTTSIMDLVANPLDGNGNGTGGDDYDHGFQIQVTNVLSNPNFDEGLQDWTATSANPGEILASIEDSSNAPTSGSALIRNLSGIGASFGLGQCANLVGPGPHRIGGRVRISGPSGLEPVLDAQLQLFSRPDCQGVPHSPVLLPLAAGDTGGLWSAPLEAFTGDLTALSVRATFAVSALSATNFQLELDDVFLSLDPAFIFADGFESGGTSQWSSAIP